MYIHSLSQLQAVWVFSLIDYEPPTYRNGDYTYPWWAEALGWGIASLSLVCIPAFAVYVLIRAEGETFLDVSYSFVIINAPRAQILFSLYGKHIIFPETEKLHQARL